MFATCWLVCLPLIVLVWLEKRLSDNEVLFALFGQLLAILPGFPGQGLRGAYYFGTLDRCSWETHIGFGTLFTHRGAEMARHASMGAYCVIGHAQIGAHVMIGSRVSIPSGKRQHLDDEGRLANVTRFERVAVGSRCWIGEGAIIMADVGGRSIVSAGAVVTQEMPGGALIGGNPARVIRKIGYAESMEGEV
jgi:virginiamycin A acetyltransferase